MLSLVHAAPDVEAEVVPADVGLDPSSARAFTGDRDLTELIRVEGAKLKVSLGACDRYPGANRITLSARDSKGRVAKLLVEFDEPGHEKEPLVSGQVLVTFKEGVTALDPSMRQCARGMGALMSPDSSSADRFGEYRIPSCLGAWMRRNASSPAPASTARTPISPCQTGVRASAETP